MPVIYEDNNQSVSYYQHEAEMFRLERVQIRMWYACMILLALLIVSNAYWILCFMEVK